MTLPDGFRVKLVLDAVAGDDGRLLVGGSPLTVMRLGDRARNMVRHLGEITVTDAPSAHLAERLLATDLGMPHLQALPAVAEDDLTVVVPVRDRPDQLDHTLKALRPLHCLVVDDASAHPDLVATVARLNSAQLIQLPVNVGPAGARNAGLEVVATPYVAFVDSDVEVTASDLVLLARHFADPVVSLVGPRICGIARSPKPSWFESYDAAASALTLGPTPGNVRPGATVAWLPSACLVARTEALEAGFNPNLRVGEDVDLVWRLVEAGHRVRYEPGILAHHDARRTAREGLGRRFVYGTGGAALAARHGDNLAPAVLTPTYALAAAVLLLRTRWAIPLAAAALAICARSVRNALPDVPGRESIARRLAVGSLAWAVRQEGALLLRHWWPAAVAGALVSRRVRRALASAIVIDALTVLFGHEQDKGLNFATTTAGRRLDDLAYGAGLWWGAIEAGSVRVLLPRRPRSRRKVAPPQPFLKRARAFCRSLWAAGGGL